MAYLAPIRGGLTPSQYYAAANKGLSGKIYNVEHYGAVHNGVADDTVAIQDAINACFSAGGGTVFFPNGVYIVAGALQNDVGDNAIDYNSQLYIPESINIGTVIEFIGESQNWFPSNNTDVNDTSVILKSTIAGTGVFPSVICSMKAGATMNFTVPIIRNIKIIVDAFEGTTGPSMCGINFIYADTSYLDNVTVTIDCNIMDSIEPENHVFGIATGVVNDNFPRIGKVVVSGFYYGVILGEGVVADTIHAYYNKFGLVSHKNNYANHIQYAVCHWNAYDIASQQETFYGIDRHNSQLKIDYLASEDGYEGDGRTPAWCYKVDEINDDVHLLFGRVDYTSSTEAGLGTDITKSTGGHNLLVRNILRGQTYKWTTATRPATASSVGILGYNSTINKMECWDGSSWVALT